MSKIIERTFDASKRIFRSVFRGHPNLFTTSDVNRQIEALKWQIDDMEETYGSPADIGVSVNTNTATEKFTVHLNPGANVKEYITAKGCNFKPKFESTQAFDLILGDVYWVCMTANETEVDYPDNEEIAGAYFEDDSSWPSALQKVYDEGEIVITKDYPSNTVAFLGRIVVETRSGVLNAVWYQNHFKRTNLYGGTPLTTRVSEVEDNFNTVKTDLTWDVKEFKEEINDRLDNFTLETIPGKIGRTQILPSSGIITDSYFSCAISVSTYGYTDVSFFAILANLYFVPKAADSSSGNDTSSNPFFLENFNTFAKVYGVIPPTINTASGKRLIVGSAGIDTSEDLALTILAYRTGGSNFASNKHSLTITAGNLFGNSSFPFPSNTDNAGSAGRKFLSFYLDLPKVYFGNDRHLSFEATLLSDQ